MATTSLYLNFNRTTEAAFLFYQSVFGGDFIGGMARMSDAPQDPERPLAEEDKNLVLHVALPLLGDMVLMGTDATESMGFTVKQGNNVSINLQPDTKEEADRFFSELASGGTIDMPMQDMFWGDYFGACVDKFGICWMVTYTPPATS